ncbi:hypothetical protein [Streptomyces sp. NPDC093089]|uniref:hypothetical protein n=1 Tax=Streptomyces sp. NPDC093089 TaxID=3366024 RepID=UPI0038246DE9
MLGESRRGADRVDEALRKYCSGRGIGGVGEVRERVVVALTGGPEGDALIRRARFCPESPAWLVAPGVHDRRAVATGYDELAVRYEATVLDAAIDEWL